MSGWWLIWQNNEWMSIRIKEQVRKWVIRQMNAFPSKLLRVNGWQMIDWRMNRNEVKDDGFSDCGWLQTIELLVFVDLVIHTFNEKFVAGGIPVLDYGQVFTHKWEAPHRLIPHYSSMLALYKSAKFVNGKTCFVVYFNVKNFSCTHVSEHFV